MSFMLKKLLFSLFILHIHSQATLQVHSPTIDHLNLLEEKDKRKQFFLNFKKQIAEEIATKTFNNANTILMSLNQFDKNHHTTIEPLNEPFASEAILALQKLEPGSEIEIKTGKHFDYFVKVSPDYHFKIGIVT